MLKALHTDENRIPQPITIKELDYDNPFYEGLQYNAPARGVWNIVHTGMLIPDSHQVYVCAQGCLRGVILTAAEMNSMERMSWVALRESDMWNGEMEKRVIEGTRHIVEQLSPRPRSILIYLSCMHMFEGCDFKMITDELSQMFPGIDFVECYMIPTMRKTMSPDAMMKISLYEAVKKKEKDPDLVGLVGSNLPFDKDSDLQKLIKCAGKRVWDIADCKNYDDYLELGSASMLISNLSVADPAIKQLSSRIDARWIKAPLHLNERKIRDSILRLGRELGLSDTEINDIQDSSGLEALKALNEAGSVIGRTPIVIDYTSFPYIMELAELLIAYGFNVTRLYSDGFPADERDAYEWVKENRPELEIFPTNDPAMRYKASNTDIQHDGCKVLAIGQKAAYFNNTPYFVDIVEGGGMYGYQAIAKLAKLMIEAYNEPKEIKKTIEHKGWSCESCL